MSIRVQDILTRASTILQDVEMKRWKQATLLDWLNEGQREMVRPGADGFKPDAKVATTQVTLVTGAKQSLPADGVALVEVQQTSDGATVLPCQRDSLDQFSPNWRTKPTASTVKNFMPDPANSTVFWVYPAQNSTPATVLMTYTVQPNIVSYTGNIDVRDIYAENLLNFVLYKAFSVDAEFGGDTARATAYYQLFAK